MSITEQLAILKVLDPETWQKIYDQHISGYRIYTCAEICTSSGHVKEDGIQGEIQRAIAAKGLYGEVQWGPERAFARITKWWNDFTEPEEIAMVQADSPASALLSAYISALKAIT